MIFRASAEGDFFCILFALRCQLVIERLRNLGSTPDAVVRCCIFGKNTSWYFPSWSQAVYPLWWPSLTKDMQTEQLLCWRGMTDTRAYNI